jgi:malonyl-CoA O-methyltransferase
MTAMIESRQLRRRFSNAAVRYTAVADIQTAIASDLAGRLPVSAGTRVLDVGAGNGTLASELVRKGADVVALDVAWGMVCHGHRSSPDAAWVQADAAALPFASGNFDLVVSSSAYQWVDDLTGAFREARRVLKPGGRFMVAMFAHGTLDELFVSMEQAAHSSSKTLPVLRRLHAADDVRAALHKAGFKDPVISVEKRVSGFQDVKAILSWLKGIGANGSARKFFWGKALLAATEREYRLSFAQGDKLRATFEIIWIEAKA